MRFFRRRKPSPCVGHPGIRLRISTPSGVVLEVDSDELHHLAVLGGDPHGGWTDLIAGGDLGAMEFSTVPLKIEIKPVRLSEPADV